MSLLDTIKSAVLADETDISAPEETVATPLVTVERPAPVVASDPAVTNSFLEKLRAKLQVPGSGIEKFESALSSLSMVPDEAMRFTAALSVLKGFGIDVKQLRLSYAAKLGALDQEVKNFQSAVTNQNGIGAKQDQLKQISADLEAKAAEIRDLTAKRDAISGEIATAQNKLEAAKAGFCGAVNIMRAELQGAIARLADKEKV